MRVVDQLCDAVLPLEEHLDHLNQKHITCFRFLGGTPRGVRLIAYNNLEVWANNVNLLQIATATHELTSQHLICSGVHCQRLDLLQTIWV
jgi:hypothetical protein